MLESKKQLRQELRTARNQIPADRQASASQNLCQRIKGLSCYSKAKNIAFYWPHDSEINPMPLLDLAMQQHKSCFLPVLLIDPVQKLGFASYTKRTPLIKNRYGILEPEVSFAQLIDIIDLDIIYVPLVGFDGNGRRLGRGGGFYDATFADLHKGDIKKWPKLVGLGYSCQHVAEIPTDSWDWQLDAVVTESDVINFK